ncbi:PilZ domain-containing protein [Marinobacterium jannaschii]|uniref:PilZ domain-containing protein n=1 Tax=Marinobacterium jannaschii TaxID=64970 RepID=UPI000AE2F6C3|nr:PilZ domain-containing protein [Marinobacterium jannaschii]
MKSTDKSERRRFTRIDFDAATELRTRGWTSSVQLEDISFKGVLICSDKALDLLPGDHVDIIIHLAGDEEVMNLKATLAHHHQNHYGFSLHETDIDSMTHLRRLVELNLGDEKLFEREIEHLMPDAV